MTKLSDQERKLLCDLLIAKLAMEGCSADPAYTAALMKLSGVDTVVWVERAVAG